MTVRTRHAPYAGWRALAATVLVMLGALGAHTWAGGHVPDGPVLLALAGLVHAASLLVLRGTATWRLLLPLVAVAQVGLHTTLTTTATGAGHVGHGGHLDAASGAASSGASWSWQMLAAHAGVTVLTALVWRLCERAAVTVVTLAEPAVAVVVPRLRDLPPARLPASLPLLVFLSVAPRRGPPVPQHV